MTPRRLATGRRCLVAGALATLLLTGCGTGIRPGAAAVVNGHVISQDEVDELVLAACDYSKAVRLEQGGAEPAQSMADLRSRLALALIQFEITNAAAAQLGLSVSEAKIGQLTSANPPMPPGLGTASRDLLEEFLYSAARAQLQQAVVGANLRDPKITTADAVTLADAEAATKYLGDFASKQDVTVNPTYGEWDGSTLVDVSGSLSDPVSTTPTPADPAADPVEDLPPSQVCG